MHPRVIVERNLVRIGEPAKVRVGGETEDIYKGEITQILINAHVTALRKFSPRGLHLHTHVQR